MIIDKHRPAKVRLGFIWKCPYCDRLMILEKGVNTYSGYYLERIMICPDCYRSRYTDADKVLGEVEE